jgi:non-ribosomal peptide synthetase component F
MVEDSGPVVLLLERGKEELFSGMDGRLRMIELCGENPVWGGEEESNPARAAGLSAESLAYVIYTSGSTGRPKGVMVAHWGLRNTLMWAKEMLGVCDQDVMMAVASWAFDISLLELMTPWLGGGSSVILSRMEIVDVERLVGRLKGATILHTVPSLMREVIGVVRREKEDSYPRQMRTLLIGGDRVGAEVLEEMREVFPGCGIQVLYGPTEGSIICAHWGAGGEEGSKSAIGRPIGNMRIYILDEEGEPVPVGVEWGEGI